MLALLISKKLEKGTLITVGLKQTCDLLKPIPVVGEKVDIMHIVSKHQKKDEKT